MRGSVEETLNALLDAEADRLCNAPALRAQRGPPRYPRRPLRAQPADQGWRGAAEGAEAWRHRTFETAIIERYRRRESSVEEALIEMYLAGVSVRRVEDMSGRAAFPCKREIVAGSTPNAVSARAAPPAVSASAVASAWACCSSSASHQGRPNHITSANTATTNPATTIPTKSTDAISIRSQLPTPTQRPTCLDRASYA